MRGKFCRPRPMPTAAEATASAPGRRRALDRRGRQRRIVVVRKLRWPETGVKLSVQFLDNPPADLRRHILLHMNAWSKTANVKFTETRRTGDVRIARLDHPPKDAGYWSYIGKEIRGIDEDKPTMNLDSFTMNETEAEFKRVVRHEAGHTLGFDHEHMRSDMVGGIDKRKAYAYFRRECGWSKEEVDDQVLTTLEDESIMGTTEADPLSIMCYQLPGDIMKNGIEIPGGMDINKVDARFAGKLYPKRARGR